MKMVKNLSNKNRNMENTDAEVVEKKVKKKKSKLTSKQNEKKSISVNKKKHKRKSTDKDDINEETAAKIPKIEEKNQTEDNDKDAKKSKGPSKRDIKKAKAAQRELEKMEQCKQETTEKALNYISMWKHARSEWKFMKIRQIWLIDHLLDESAVPDSIFPTVLEYFEGCKGMAREILLKKGMDIIKKHEQNLEDEDAEIVETVELKRARQLLQALPTET